MTLNILIFGATGSIGNYMYKKLREKYNVYATTSSTGVQANNFFHVKLENNKLIHNLLDQNIPKLDGIIWAHGKNINDSINTISINDFNSIMECNVTFILATLKLLIDSNLLNKNAKMCIISSIWEEFTRDNKLSYSISKACLGNLVKNVAYDLAKENILINNILPGPIMNEMTVQTLSKTELDYITNYTHFNRLISLDDIFHTLHFLLVENTGITGQSIKVDLGFTNIKKYN